MIITIYRRTWADDVSDALLCLLIVAALVAFGWMIVSVISEMIL